MMSKRTYNRLDYMFRDFMNSGIPKMLIDHVSMGYKDARSAHRSLYHALKNDVYNIGVEWCQGVVYLVRTDKN
jgi:hypothetical protein